MKTLLLIFLSTTFALSAPVPQILKKPKPIGQCLNDCAEEKTGERNAECIAKCKKDSPCKNNCCVYETTTTFNDGKQDGEPKTKKFFDGCSSDGSSVCYPGPDEEYLAGNAGGGVPGIPKQMPAKIDSVTVKKTYEETSGPCDSTKSSACSVLYGSDTPEAHEAIVDSICANFGITKQDYSVVGLDCEVKCTHNRNFETIEAKKISFPFAMCRPWLKDKKPILDSTTYKQIICGVCTENETQNISARLLTCKSWSHEIPDPTRDAVIESFKKNPPAFLPKGFYDKEKKGEKSHN